MKRWHAMLLGLTLIVNSGCRTITGDDILLAATDRAALGQALFEASGPAVLRVELDGNGDLVWQAMQRLAKRDGRRVMTSDATSRFLLFAVVEEEHLSLVNTAVYVAPGTRSTTVLARAFVIQRTESRNFGVPFWYMQASVPHASDIAARFLNTLEEEMALRGTSASH